MGPVLQVRGVSKRYGENVVLRDVSFEVEAGSLVALTGRSGSGKSSLFRLLAGLDRPDGGEILVEGVDLGAMDDDAASKLRLHRLGIVFQSLNLLPDLTAEENVRLPLDIAGVPRGEARARARDILQRLGLAGAIEQRPTLLSGGEAQRVAIARALVNAPAIVLADEPTGSLDRANAEAVLAMLERANRELGATILLVTHDPLAVERFPRRLHLDEGVLRWQAPMATGPRPA